MAGAYVYDNIRQYAAPTTVQNGKTVRGYMPSIMEIIGHYLGFNGGGSSASGGAVDMRGARSSHDPVRLPDADAKSIQAAYEKLLRENGGADTGMARTARGAIGLNNVVQNGLAGFSRYAPSLKRGATNSASWLREGADKADGMADNWLTTLKSIEANTSSTAKNTKDANEIARQSALQMGNSIDVLARVLTFAAQDAALAAVR